jgi:hypothetical protein
LFINRYAFGYAVYKLYQLHENITKARYQPLTPEPYAVLELSEGYLAEVWQLLMQYGLFKSEEEWVQALEPQARECGV